ncbi:UxaA family hydrolase [Siminovitchia terrae]|uniref:D-galactarate dehydratase n=1 Tax=Siminovitchia terrae TaxID=1914933 RepID=A0A429X8P8_SIMTE|nr:UxaA family hydrolase [Siminovitchia terrae]RST59825.1 D-galactarate dehydratase [Siminovitchia terrae]
MRPITFNGFRRTNGAVGIRNHVAIIPVDGLANLAAKHVAHIAHGSEAFVHPFGELQFGLDLELTFKTVIGIGSNPNVAAAVVIGQEPEWTKIVAQGIAETGKPVAYFTIERYGDLATIEKATRKAIEFIQYSSELQREETPISELVISIKCSESDPTSGHGSNPTLGKTVEMLLDMGTTIIFGETTELTGAEHTIASRFKNQIEQEKFWQVYNEYIGFLKSQHAHLLGSQPTQGNIRGGLTTIEEKAWGNIQKIGQAMIEGVLHTADSPPGKGLWFMNTSASAVEVATVFAAAGATLQIITTGQGNIVGNPVTPVIKMSANPLTVSTMSEHIDLDVKETLYRTKTFEQCKEMLMDLLIRTVNGRLTKSEVLGHRDFLPPKLYRNP